MGDKDQVQYDEGRVFSKGEDEGRRRNGDGSPPKIVIRGRKKNEFLSTIDSHVQLKSPVSSPKISDVLPFPFPPFLSSFSSVYPFLLEGLSPPSFEPPDLVSTKYLLD